MGELDNNDVSILEPRRYILAQEIFSKAPNEDDYMKRAHKGHNIMTQCQTILKKSVTHKFGYQISANWNLESISKLSMSHLYTMLWINFFQLIQEILRWTLSCCHYLFGMMFFWLPWYEDVTRWQLQRCMSYVHELEVIIEAVNCITLHINYGLNKESNSNSNA